MVAAITEAALCVTIVCQMNGYWWLVVELIIIDLMKTQQVAQWVPLARQAAVTNGLLLIYFLLPNFTSFFLTTLLLSALLAPALLQQISCCDSGSCWSFNALFAEYLRLSGVRKLMVVVGLGVVAQLTYLLPSWVIVLLAGEVIAFWELLVGLGAVEMVVGAINGTEAALTKFLNLIPKYEEA